METSPSAALRVAAMLACLSGGFFLVGSRLEAQIQTLDLQVVESPALDGEAIPGVGQYEHLRGLAHGVLDPADPQNQIIVNLDRAPRNADGLVEYSTVVDIYRPLDMSQWNRAIYHNVANRGRRGSPDPALLRRGFAFVDVGWQGDIADNGRNVVAILPVARAADGSSITGRAVEELIFDDADQYSNGVLSYPAASLDAGGATLTVRRHQADRRRTLANKSWRYLNDKQIRIERPASYDGGAIYEFVYEAADPIVMGIGFAAVRDVISFLRYANADAAGEANPLTYRGTADHTLSIGISQSGRMLRDMLYLGFNEDLEGRIVFDGMHPDIAGSRKTFTNYAFSQPGRWQKQHEDHFYPGDQFPFTYGVLTDPVSGRSDGLLARCTASNTCPKVVHTDGEAEIWQARSSLVVTDPAGEDIPLPENVRTYLISGTQHGGGGGVHNGTLGFGSCQNFSNPMPLSEVRRALTVALYEWVAKGEEPPPSQFPTRKSGGLVTPTKVHFPAIPGVSFSGSVNSLRELDHSSYPPGEGENYPVFVGRVDADGNMMDGIRHPFLAVPIGTHTGWNLRREGFSPGSQCGGTGSFIPFARTKQERLESGDPRLSIEERYGSLGEYVTLVSRHANELVAARYLLPEDAQAIVVEALRSGVADGRR